MTHHISKPLVLLWEPKWLLVLPVTWKNKLCTKHKLIHFSPVLSLGKRYTDDVFLLWKGLISTPLFEVLELLKSGLRFTLRYSPEEINFHVIYICFIDKNKYCPLHKTYRSHYTLTPTCSKLPSLRKVHL